MLYCVGVDCQAERCFDTSVLSAILRHPQVWPDVADDGSGEREQFELCGDAVLSWIWLLVRYRGMPAGFAAFEPRTAALAEFHGGVLPEFRGQIGFELARAAMRAYWQQATRPKLAAFCPVSNRGAQRVNAAMGFRREGVLTDAYLRRGKLENVIVYGMTRDQCTALQGE